MRKVQLIRLDEDSDSWSSWPVIEYISTPFEATEDQIALLVEGLCEVDSEGYECNTGWFLVEHGNPTDLTPYFNEAERNLAARKKTEEEREARRQEWEALEDLTSRVRSELKDNTPLGLQIRELMGGKIS